MSIPSTSVKWMSAGMTGAPVLGNNWGDLTALLRACAVNGFNVKPVQAITCSGTTATVQCNGHGFIAHQVVRIDGADPTGYNGEHRIVSVVDANTVTITLAAALAPASTASGQTLQMRAAPLGFEQLFSSGNKLALRSANQQSPRNVLRVDDSCPTGYTTTWGKFARVSIAQDMSDIDTLIGARAPFDPLNPTKNEDPSGTGTTGYYGWYKWVYALSSEWAAFTSVPTNGGRQWVFVGDDRGFYLFHPASTANSYLRAVNCFTDIDSLQAPDAFATMLGAQDNYLMPTASVSSARDRFTRASQSAGIALLRDHTGVGNWIAASPISLRTGPDNTSFYSGYSNNIPYPNGPGNAVLMHPIYVQQPDGNIRGKIPGLLHIMHRITTPDLTMIESPSSLPGRMALQIQVVQISTGAPGYLAIDITGPWR